MTRSIFFDELHDMTISELLVAVTGDAIVASDGRWRSLTLGIGVGSEITAAPVVRVSYFPEEGDDSDRIITIEALVHNASRDGEKE